MTIQSFLHTATHQLREAGIASARLDCLILLEDATGRARAYLLAHPEHELAASQTAALRQQVAARSKHMPLAYIRGKAFFYGREFFVNEHVLIPRPETETMIDMLKALPLRQVQIADIGTGSGCIGITAALELPEAQVYVFDIDPLALLIARHNAKALDAPVTAAHANLLEETGGIDVILTNLPYVPDNFPVHKAVRHEPSIALYAGEDGLDVYRAFWQQLRTRTYDTTKYVMTESLAVQHDKLHKLARAAGYRLTAAQGLIQQFERVGF